MKQYINLWNEMAERAGLCKVRIFTATRKAKLKARLKEAEQIDDPMDVWREALDWVEASPFLTGDNDRNWKAGFDFVVQEKSFAKLIEGEYGGDVEGLERQRAWKIPDAERSLDEWRLVLGDATDFTRKFTLQYYPERLRYMPAEIKREYGFIKVAGE